MNKKVLKWNFIFQYGYVLTNIFNSIILLPLYLKHIDATTLGIWLATGNILAWMTLTDPGVGDILQQKIAELRGKKLVKDVCDTIGSGFIASGIILIISVLVGFIFYFLLGVIINKDVSQYPNLQIALVISIIATGMSLVSFSMSGINQGLHNSANVAIASMLANIVFLVLNIMFLYLDFGIISIAFANMCRSLFINVYNFVSMQKALKREGLKINFDIQHFKSFIKIFSFTSVSRIISGLSGSLDMIILARYIAPSMITVYEINRRPINMTQGLIGRHSVALMPLISHAKGKEDHKGIISFINKQFRLYTYAALFTTFIFWLLYKDLISLWTGSSQYAGDTIINLLLITFFFNLIGYFMSNMGYALGDIKMNSFINILKGIVVAIMLFFVGRAYGITGTIVVWLSITLIADFFYFSYRLYKLGYLQITLLKSVLNILSLLVPISILFGWLLKMLMNRIFQEQMYLQRLLLNATIFTTAFLLVVLLTDREIRNVLRALTLKFRLYLS
ncbi:MAG: Membrane protein involved in the export of O-antigen and teichoic acid [Segetibacter sp.]|nr:Membrane protein involved in the export of O-antigen and teichoic acid [Segetibacter sp.]